MLKRIKDSVTELFAQPRLPVESFTFTFPGSTETVHAVRALRHHNPHDIAEALGFSEGRPSIAVMGGAGKMDAASIALTRSMIEDGLAQFAEEHQIAVVDGGTQAGVMGMIGGVRKRRRCTFPLIGVVPDALVAYPGHENPNALVELDHGHSHFVFTEGDRFGDESDLLASVAYAIGQGKRTHKRTVGLIINGGEIAKREARARAVGSLRFTLLVLEGSGRFADELAMAHRAGRTDDPVIEDILTHGQVTVLPLSAGADNLRKTLANFFGF